MGMTTHDDMLDLEFDDGKLDRRRLAGWSRGGRRNDIAGIADDKDLTRAKPGDQVRNDTGIGAGDNKITRALAMSQNQKKVLVLLELVLLKRSDALNDLPHELSPRRAGGIARVIAPADPLAATRRASRDLVNPCLRLTIPRFSRDQT